MSKVQVSTSGLVIGTPGNIVKGVWRATQLIKYRVKWDELCPWSACSVLLTVKGTKTDRFICIHLYFKCHGMGFFLLCLMSNPIFTNGDRNSLKRFWHSQVTVWQHGSSLVLLEVNSAPSSGKNVWHIDVIKYKKKDVCTVRYSLHFPRADLAQWTAC